LEREIEKEIKRLRVITIRDGPKRPCNGAREAGDTTIVHDDVVHVGLDVLFATLGVPVPLGFRIFV